MALSDKDLKILTENNLKRKYQALFLTSIRFEGIDQATSDYLMSKLMYEGRVAAFKLKPSKLVEYEELVFASFAESKWKWNGMPLAITVINEFRAPYFPTRPLLVQQEAVVLKLAFRPYSYITEYVERIVAIQETIDTNLAVHQMPFIIKSTDKKLLDTMKKIFRREKVVVINDTTIEVLTTNAPYIIDKLQLFKAETEAELLTLLGIDSVKFEKKAQMTKDEINSNNEEITSYEKTIRGKLETFFEEIKEVLGYDIKIKEEPRDLIIEEDYADYGNGGEE